MSLLYGGVSPSKLERALQELGVEGIVYPGTQSYFALPHLATRIGLGAALAADTDGAFADFAGSAAIDADYYPMMIVVTPGDADRFRLKLKPSGHAVNHVEMAIAGSVNSGVGKSHGSTFGIEPFRVPKGTALATALADGSAAALGVEVSFGYFKGIARLRYDPELMRSVRGVGSEAIRFPTTIAAGSVVATSASAWTYGSYVQLTAGVPYPVVITHITGGGYNGGTHQPGQIALATGAGGLETIWAEFPYGGSQDLVFSNTIRLTPGRFLLPANTRLAIKAANQAAGGLSPTFAVHGYKVPTL